MPVKQWQNKSGVKPKKCVQCVPTDLHSDSNYLEYLIILPYIHPYHGKPISPWGRAGKRKYIYRDLGDFLNISKT
jgi:hypothetical protein